MLAAIACHRGSSPVVPGVTRALAERRASTISDIRYSLYFAVPESLTERVAGSVGIHFTLSDAGQPLVLDFTAPEGSVKAVQLNHESVAAAVRDGHVVIPARRLAAGENLIEIQFLAGDLSLNRNPDFLYTLFVPDRASSAFPCFDQPDLKARFALTLETPVAWKAVANGPLAARDTAAGRALWKFSETPLLPTYLFAFATGRFRVETAVRDGREMHMYHRETDSAKVRRNRDAIFDLHARAIAWLEQYTGIRYPFPKFDFVLIPAFQYGGMEHAGAILYNASGLLLDESATQNQYLGRASVIAHETSHMWFGDLVTMRWFNDVWMKEVFANFMAAKIVNPSFPKINHTLRFYLAHFPAAYSTDRTAGANPIRQQLDNLQDAGTLYGNIIYQKAPIVMQHLEALVGEEPFRDGLRKYLTAHRFGNATWPDLITLLDRRTPQDLAAWSHAWVEEPGRPIVRVLRYETRGTLDSVVLEQTDPRGRGLVWPQRIGLWLAGEAQRTTHVELDAARAVVPGTTDLPHPTYVLAGSDASAYGRFVLDDSSRVYLLRQLPEIPDPTHRAVAWVTLWDAMLEGEVTPLALVNLTLTALPREDNELVLGRALGLLDGAYWKFLTPVERQRVAPEVESVLWRGVTGNGDRSRRAALLDSYLDVFLTKAGVERVTALWRKILTLHDLPLAERHFTRMALELAVRAAPGWQAILDQQGERIENPDRRVQFAFVRPALAADTVVRDRFFDSLADPANREHEPWALQALRYLNHPLRAQHALKYVRPSLDLLEEVQRTGDVFFPGRWLGSALSGHQSPEAAAIVRRFLKEHPNYPPKLREKILQEADDLFRAAQLAR